MAPPRGSAAYKKQDGTLAISKDGQSVSWTPVTPPGSKPALMLSISTITNLQQTPANSSKVMLKIFVQQKDASASDTHVFTFTSPTAPRAEADAIKDALGKTIQQAKAGTSVITAPGGGASSAAMAIASAISSAPQTEGDKDDWYTDESLKANAELQQSLLKADPGLSKTFMESLRTKPESITSSQFTTQFWSSRIHMLRSYAIDKSQARGSYNVLASFKPETKDNTLRLSISKEQIQLIFNQYPVVRRAYDENVPKISESEFWVKFFQSRLFKKLKGEKITEADPKAPLIDKYLDIDEEAERAKRLLSAHIPHIIDIEGNEENHSQRKGNAPDISMRPATSDRVPIIRTLNTLSEKILSQVTPDDVDPSLPIGVDEETFNLLALQDLRSDEPDNRVILNIKDASRFFNSSKDSDDSLSANPHFYARQSPTKTLSSLRAELATLRDPKARLEPLLGVHDSSSSSSSSSDSDSATAKTDSSKTKRKRKTSRVGSKAARRAATTHLMSSIRDHIERENPSSGSPSQGLSPAIYDRLLLTHATSTEFLAHFWSAFVSGDAARALELQHLSETLSRCLDRIKAVEGDAERERQGEIEKIERQAREHERRTGRKVKGGWEKGVGGGGKVVREVLGDTTRAIEDAVGAYRKALREAGEEELLNGTPSRG
ncbi:MAG: hypothetical protein LQ342_004636 [Letrouitia transgressa]|nr:MAG: hypothetical protein LQ342_004636 [Letrouitia transgressa]